MVIVIIIVVQIGPVMGNEEEYILEGRGIGWGSWHVLLSSLRFGPYGCSRCLLISGCYIQKPINERRFDHSVILSPYPLFGKVLDNQ